jgi:hypothetical protein
MHPKQFLGLDAGKSRLYKAKRRRITAIIKAWR